MQRLLASTILIKQLKMQLSSLSSRSTHLGAPACAVHLPCWRPALCTATQAAAHSRSSSSCSQPANSAPYSSRVASAPSLPENAAMSVCSRCRRRELKPHKPSTTSRPSSSSCVARASLQRPAGIPVIASSSVTDGPPGFNSAGAGSAAISAATAASGLPDGVHPPACIQLFLQSQCYRLLQHIRKQLWGVNMECMFPEAAAVALAAPAYATQHGHCKTCPFRNECTARGACSNELEGAQQNEQAAGLQSKLKLFLLEALAARFWHLQLDAPVAECDLKSRRGMPLERSLRVLFYRLREDACGKGAAYDIRASMDDSRWPAPLYADAANKNMATATFRKQQTARGADVTGQDADHILGKAMGGPKHIFDFIMLWATQNRSFGAQVSAAKVETVGFWPCYVALLLGCVNLEALHKLGWRAL